MTKQSILIIAWVLLCIGTTKGQSLSHSVIGSAGGDQSNGNVSLSFTVGETAIETFSAGDHILTQGFHQPTEEDDEDPNTIFSDINAGIEVSQYPNPFRNEFRVTISTDAPSAYDLQLYSVTGQQLDVPFRHTERGGDIQFTVKAGDLPEGVYLLRITDRANGESHTAKLTKIQ